MLIRFPDILDNRIEFLSMADNLLYHRAHLINLDRIDDKVLRFIAVLLSGLPKT